MINRRKGREDSNLPGYNSGGGYYGSGGGGAAPSYSYGGSGNNEPPAKQPSYSGYGSAGQTSGFGIGVGNADTSSSPYSAKSANRMTMGGVKSKSGGGGGGLGSGYSSKRRGSSSFPFDMKLIVSVAFAIIMGITAYTYRSSYNSILTKFHSQTVMDAVKNYEKLESEKKRYENEARNNRSQQTTLKTSIRDLERQNRDKQKQLEDLRTKMNDAKVNNQRSEEQRDNDQGKAVQLKEENDYMTKREKAWRDQVWLLQNATQREAWRTVVERFGTGPHHVKFVVMFDNEEKAEFKIELAPLQLLPHANHFFLEQVYHELWDGTWFYLNGPHVLQAGPQDWEEEDAGKALSRFKEARLDQLSYPEYHPEHPHKPWTLGFTGRPGGPEFYINKADNSIPHGPGGQWQHGLEEQADSCFAKVVEGQDILQRIFQSESYTRDSDYPFFLYDPVEIISARIEEKIEDKIKKPEKIKNKNKNKRKNKPQRKTINQETVDAAREKQQQQQQK
mmetsp:Transcript_19731/g.22567  ORF Transcript_19731/g.22567 Transcript_19731/m.22567 type:complete len:504 (-) Transcript_19731:167-1678(-)|eukprot:CAMPEP_0194139202 /NCGR_PEP_ID=MMETSP0152-20130528/8916_1 /TAXON_ID=1049557 /ORGANISM="Thalassiothrix antarctica, Strain L6-D1" /LENGTH=503 /DNA_ID=CAMNT_0038836979 /DNA_START=147 /DNA_END=1658 /DNA_ORIENTATION=-